MERLSTIGVSWRGGDLKRVACLTVAEDARPRALRELAQRLGTQEIVYLATCNRVEVVFRRPAGAPLAPLRAPVFEVLSGRAPGPAEAEHALRAWAGEGAVEHLFLVAAGLDSAQLGETEIAGQVRRASELSRAAGLFGPLLAELFEEALRLARRVRQETGVGSGRTSLAELALEVVRERLAQAPAPVSPTVALIGISPMTERVGAELAAAGVALVVVNRTLARAQELAQRLGARARGLDEFRLAPEPVDALVAATGAPCAVLDRAALARLAALAPNGRAPLIVDLALPPDVSPDDALALGLARVGAEELTQRAAATRSLRLAAAAEARIAVDQALERWRRSRADRALAPVLTALRTHYQAAARDGAQRLLRRELASLGAAERAALERFAESLARRMAHLPSVGLRELAAEHGPAALRAFFRGAEPRLCKELAALATEVADELDRRRAAEEEAL